MHWLRTITSDQTTQYTIIRRFVYPLNSLDITGQKLLKSNKFITCFAKFIFCYIYICYIFVLKAEKISEFWDKKFSMCVACYISLYFRNALFILFWNVFIHYLAMWKGAFFSKMLHSMYVLYMLYIACKNIENFFSWLKLQ